MSPDSGTDRQFDELLEYLQRSRGFDFTAYKRASLVRRVQKRMETVAIDTYAAYTDFLEAHPQEFTQLFNTILINVTSFFRDPQTWDGLSAEVIPRIISSHAGTRTIRMWSAGCSSGEEAYTLAMLMAEALGETDYCERVKIYATDVDEEALAEARAGSYSQQDIQAVPDPLVGKYFTSSNGRFVFNKDLRQPIIFGRHDLILDPPISRVALIVCRNALMYLNSEVQQRILDRFAFSLREGGFLFLGKAEMLLTRSAAFSPVDVKRRIFLKVRHQIPRQGAMMAYPRLGQDAASPDRLRDLVFHTDQTAQLVVDRQRIITLINDRARVMFALSAEDVGRPLQDLEISYRPIELQSMIEEACNDRRSVNAKDITWSTPAGEQLELQVLVAPLNDATGEVLGAKILFRDVTRSHQLEEDLKRSREELETTTEELQSTNEELEATNEELQSTVEELETTNEELQSTNEELETMNEELQSTNEELQTANEQLRVSGDELNRASSFFETVLNSFSDGLIVVDSELRVRAWNTRAEDLWGLRSSEVNGKHLMNIDIGLPLDQLRQPIRKCISGESPTERLVVTARNRRGRAVEIVVTCTPFEVARNPNWGAVIMMEERPAELAPS